MKHIITTTLITLLCLTAIAQTHLIGPWHGDISVGQQHLPLVLNISHDDSGYSATIDSPAQGAKGIPADIDVIGDSIDVSIHVIGARYSGRYADGLICGQFSQSGMTFPLGLTPGEYIPPRPQTPKPPYPYETRQIRIVNSIDSTILSATLTLPIQYSIPIYHKRNFPLVVMVTGSGLQNRDEEIYGHRPFAVIAHHLAQCGIMSVRYDDRGFANSTGEVSHATTATFASDAEAVIDWARHNVDRVSLIGILGHSEGGEIAFMLAPRDMADFIVTIGAPAMRGDSLLIAQNRALFGSDASADQYIEALTRALQYMAANPQTTEWPQFEEAFADLQLLSESQKDNLMTIIANRNPWLDYYLSYDPTEAISSTHVPVFALNGALDVQVDADANLDIIRALLPANPKNLIKKYPGLNHLMQHAHTGLPNEYPAIEETISPEVLTDIPAWINSLP